MKRPISKVSANSHPLANATGPIPVVPSHRCQVCGAFWRIWLKADTLQDADSWSLCSPTSGKCCDNSFLGEQILPVTMAEMQEFIHSANAAHEPQRQEGPDAN